MSGIATISHIGNSKITQPNNVIRVYLSYRELRLSLLRSLLSDIEAIYNQIDRHLILQSGHVYRFRKSPLKIEEARTGQSIEILLIGSPAAVAVFSLLLSAMHSTWGVVTGTAVALGSGATAVVELRNKWLEGSKTAAEREKLLAETKKIGAEERKADAETAKTHLETEKLRRELLENNDQSDWSFRSASYVDAVGRDEPDALTDRLSTRLRRVQSAIQIKSVEISAGPKKLTLGSGSNKPTIDES